MSGGQNVYTDRMSTYKQTNELTDLSGKVAIVTGAVGIGFGIARRLGQAGAKVVVASRNKEQVDETVETLQKQQCDISGVVTDVSSEQQVQQMLDFTLKTYSRVDILVNNAGIFPTTPVMDMTLDDFEAVLSVNVKGVFLCTKYCAKQMIQQGGGRIINITSIDALHPSMVGLAHYDASKHGVWGFTKNVALELAPHKIWVNAIAPGGILTPGVQKMQQPSGNSNADQTKVLDAFLAKIPMHRMGEPDDIAKVALFLASDMASYMTGTQIVVDGGVLLS